MTDHDQTTLELIRERSLRRDSQRLVIALLFILFVSTACAAIQQFTRCRDIAVLAAKCGSDAR